MKCSCCENTMVLHLTVGLEYWKCATCGFSKENDVILKLKSSQKLSDRDLRLSSGLKNVVFY